jgi:hypothetical protein
VKNCRKHDNELSISIEDGEIHRQLSDSQLLLKGSNPWISLTLWESNEYLKCPEQVSPAVTPLSCMREVLGSYLCRYTLYRDEGFSWFSSVLLGKCR